MQVFDISTTVNMNIYFWINSDSTARYLFLGTQTMPAKYLLPLLLFFLESVYDSLFLNDCFGEKNMSMEK